MSFHAFSNSGSPARRARTFLARRKADTRVVLVDEPPDLGQGLAARPPFLLPVAKSPDAGGGPGHQHEGEAGREGRAPEEPAQGGGPLLLEAGLELRHQRLRRGRAGGGVLRQAPFDEALDPRVHVGAQAAHRGGVSRRMDDRSESSLAPPNGRFPVSIS